MSQYENVLNFLIFTITGSVKSIKFHSFDQILLTLAEAVYA